MASPPPLDSDRHPGSIIATGRIPALDGVRGLAILAVMLHNSGQLQAIFAKGWMGVDLFFVLSGFLITGILIDGKHSEGYFKNFYARRCLRIWPLYYFLLLFVLVAVAGLPASQRRAAFDKSSPWWAYPLFLQNFLVANATQAAGPLGVTWSLAIEEQFYLVWAVVVRSCTIAQVRRIAITLICLSPALRYVLSLYHVHLYTNLFCRLDGLMAGAVLSLAVRSPGFVPSKFTRAAEILLFITAPLALTIASSQAQWVVFSASAAASALFVYVALFSQHRVIQRVMTNRFLVYTGTISYGLYLLHRIPLDLAKSIHLDGKPLLFLPFVLVTSYALAALSWNFLEKPFLRLKRFFAFKPVTLKRRFPLAS